MLLQMSLDEDNVGIDDGGCTVVVIQYTTQLFWRGGGIVARRRRQIEDARKENLCTYLLQDR